MKNKLILALVAATIMSAAAPAVHAQTLVTPPTQPAAVTGYSGCLFAPGHIDQQGFGGYVYNPSSWSVTNNNWYSSGAPSDLNYTTQPYAQFGGSIQSSYGGFGAGSLSVCDASQNFATTASVNSAINTLYNDIVNNTGGTTNVYNTTNGLTMATTTVTAYQPAGTQAGGTLTGATTQTAVVLGAAATQTTASGSSTDLGSSLLAPR